MNVNDTPLYDGGNFRLYDNRIEINRYGFFGGLKGVNMIYYGDIAGVKASKKELVIKKAAMKNIEILRFRRKEQTQLALAIINRYRP